MTATAPSPHADLTYRGRDYRLEAMTRASGTRAGRAMKRFDCDAPTHEGERVRAIGTRQPYLWKQGEGRMCIPCSLALGAIEPVGLSA